MKMHSMVLLPAGLFPVAACQAEQGDQVGEGVEDGLQTTPAAESTLGAARRLRQLALT